MKEWECPVCHEMTDMRPALSRRDNETNICSECGTKEALEDYATGGEAGGATSRAIEDYLESKDMHCPTCECDEEESK